MLVLPGKSTGVGCHCLLRRHIWKGSQSCIPGPFTSFAVLVCHCYSYVLLLALNWWFSLLRDNHIPQGIFYSVWRHFFLFLPKVQLMSLPLRRLPWPSGQSWSSYPSLTHGADSGIAVHVLAGMSEGSSSPSTASSVLLHVCRSCLAWGGTW